MLQNLYLFIYSFIYLFIYSFHPNNLYIVVQAFCNKVVNISGKCTEIYKSKLNQNAYFLQHKWVGTCREH